MDANEFYLNQYLDQEVNNDQKQQEFNDEFNEIVEDGLDQSLNFCKSIKSVNDVYDNRAYVVCWDTDIMSNGVEVELPTFYNLDNSETTKNSLLDILDNLMSNLEVALNKFDRPMWQGGMKAVNYLGSQKSFQKLMIAYLTNEIDTVPFDVKTAWIGCFTNSGYELSDLIDSLLDSTKIANCYYNYADYYNHQEE